MKLDLEFHFQLKLICKDFQICLPAAKVEINAEGIR